MFQANPRSSTEQTRPGQPQVTDCEQTETSSCRSAWQQHLLHNNLVLLFFQQVSRTISLVTYGTRNRASATVKLSETSSVSQSFPSWTWQVLYWSVIADTLDLAYSHALLSSAQSCQITLCLTTFQNWHFTEVTMGSGVCAPLFKQGKNPIWAKPSPPTFGQRSSSPNNFGLCPKHSDLGFTSLFHCVQFFFSLSVRVCPECKVGPCVNRTWTLESAKVYFWWLTAEEVTSISQHWGPGISIVMCQLGPSTGISIYSRPKSQYKYHFEAGSWRGNIYLQGTHDTMLWSMLILGNSTLSVFFFQKKKKKKNAQQNRVRWNLLITEKSTFVQHWLKWSMSKLQGAPKIQHKQKHWQQETQKEKPPKTPCFTEMCHQKNQHTSSMEHFLEYASHPSC